ncbi:BatA domain-containing protein [Polaribacter sp. AHE13PA]|uniref:BatA domain-containing protein n=1 Tax=Polaribacter sp. AHE13PA TaxID=2745562 RepID=UPI001C4FC303|nr:BatA domain-containing protein [Polaribacter sp. AHE13PA]QXP68436.1 BatA domain-containing protein [Polaribacter sp. AHE13PA]
MQFKNPEILYFLALLIIPIIVHLFQLQKFVKVPFTNVAFLQKLAQQTRKSSRIKKWLILGTRTLLFTAIIFAFSQPYFSNKTANKKQHNFIYLDNSLSTNTKGKRGNLLQIAAKEIIENASEKDVYSLQTNSSFYDRITKSELKNILLQVKETSKKIDLATVLLKFDSKTQDKTNTTNKTILISDFQNTYKNEFTNVTPGFSAIKLESSIKNNISIDSVFITNSNTYNFTLNVLIKNQGEVKKNIPIAVYNNNKLISKLSSSFKKDTLKNVQFKIQNQAEFNGKITINFSDTFAFDNVFYFTIKNDQKINISSIGNKANFLPKIYTKNEFNLTQSTVQNTNYNSILKQQLIILNEVEDITEILSKKIIEFSKNGGSLVIIPHKNLNINSYNSLFQNLSLGKIQPKKTDSLKITNINYKHPLFQNVFSKKVTNFQYPTVQHYYPFSSNNKSTIVAFENGSSFISQIKNGENNTLWISSSLDTKNSNFINSPLIVPVFYNFGKMSFKHPKLFYRIASKNTIDIETNIKKDKVLKIANSENSFIPLQKKFQNKISITTKEQPLKSGIYSILQNTDTIQKIAYNYAKEESLLNFLDLNELKETNQNITVSNSVADVFKKINKKNEVHWLWKWFLSLAIVSLLLEILILKFYKP